MEQLLAILRQLMGTASAAGNIPKPVRLFVLYFGVLVGVFVIFKYANLDSGTKTFIIIAVVLLIIITGGYYGWKAWKQKQQNQQFGGEMSQHSLATPRGLSDPGQRARLDDLRKKFQSGVAAYKSRGKDLYELPWYVIVGEPGSGKTEAIRHSNIGFPPGMQDEFQGVGGTINMNWWFTNHAVLLDTAGRLMFEELKPGETSEWKEFLALLKKDRPNCPINGLFLVIPSDSLIKDSADAIQKKAGKIAQQLDVIQRVLDVRFPVFVVVTKCDKINGFREFFEGITDPQLQHQMMGWSNPSPLDDPFKPELVDKHLEQVVTRLRRRRMGLMRDPVPDNPDGRRTDEVDALFALPHSLELLGSRLRRYLETIFIAGVWSAKPLFLRGIYFSSAMAEGAALDAELAEAIGVNVDELPEGKVWERERAYFLRDLFLDKVFREKGLVTRASNTKKMLRGQQVALYGFGFAALAVFCTVAWFAMRDLNTGVKDHGDYWQAVSTAGWEDKHWGHAIVRRLGDGSFASTLSTNLIKVDNKEVTLGEFHSKLRELTEEPMKRSLMFPGLADTYNKNSRKAQRIVFEAGIVEPLVDATRQKMARHDTDPGSAQHEPDALAELIKIEADILSRGTPASTGVVTPESAERFLGSFESYISGGDKPADSNLVAVMSWTYSLNDTGKGTWAPRWLTGGRGVTNNLAVNTGIAAGLELLAHNATNDIQAFRTEQKQIAGLHDLARQFATEEAALSVAATAGAESKFVETQHQLDVTRKALDDELARLSSEPLFTGGLLLANAQQKFRDRVTASAGAKVAHVRDVNEAALAANHDYPLFREIHERLELIQVSLSNTVADLLQSGDLNEFQKLDADILAGNAFATRDDMYDRAGKVTDTNSWGTGDLIGSKAEKLESLLRSQGTQLQTDLAGYTGKMTNETSRIAAFNLERANRLQSLAYFNSYIAEANKALALSGGFPLLRDSSRIMTADNFAAASKTLKFIADDSASPAFIKYSPKDNPEWKAFVQNIEGEQAVVRAMQGDDGSFGVCRVSLARTTEATQADDVWEGTYRDMKLFFDGGNTDSVRTGTDVDQTIGDVPVQSKLEVRLYKNANLPGSPTSSILGSEWGPVWLIQHFKGEREKTDPTTWLVRCKVEAKDATGWVRLKLKFDRPLPDLDNWPHK